MIFARGLWGDGFVTRLGSIYRQVEAETVRPHQPKPLIVYCYGKQNEAYAKRHGFRTVLMDERPIVPFDGATCERNPGHRGVVNYGQIMWRHKLAIIERAVADHGEVVWLDWDCRMMVPEPPRLMQTLHAGREFQGTLIEMRQKQCGWRRTGFAGEGRSVRKVPEGAWLYFRGMEPVARCIELYRKFPDWCDQVIFAMYTDEQLGGWPGLTPYYESGYEFKYHSIYKRVFEPLAVWFATSGVRHDPVKNESEKLIEEPTQAVEARRHPSRANRLLVYGRPPIGADVASILRRDGARCVEVQPEDPTPTPDDFLLEDRVVLVMVNESHPHGLAEHIARLRPGRVILCNASQEHPAHFFDEMLVV